jgi:hypothetical protein
MEKKKIAFDKSDLETFLNETDLVIKSNALSRINGGGTYIKNVYTNYSQSTFVNKIGGA